MGETEITIQKISLNFSKLQWWLPLCKIPVGIYLLKVNKGTLEQYAEYVQSNNKDTTRTTLVM